MGKDLDTFLGVEKWKDTVGAWNIFVGCKGKKSSAGDFFWRAGKLFMGFMLWKRKSCGNRSGQGVGTDVVELRAREGCGKGGGLGERKWERSRRSKGKRKVLVQP